MLVVTILLTLKLSGFWTIQNIIKIWSFVPPALYMVYSIEPDLFEMIRIVKYDRLGDLRARWTLGVPLNLLG